MKFRGITVAVGILALLLTGSTMRAQSINMQYVTVGNPGNAADPATGSFYGSVGYTFNIGEYDVTDSQYCTFLNSVDPTGANTLDLYSPQGDAEFGISENLAAASGSKYLVIPGYANMPAVDVDYWDTLRFANYLDDGNTESGAYTLMGDTPIPSNASSVTRNAGATVWLPSQNEWYKAAYYDPANGTYSTYATQSNTAPGNVVDSGSNEANYYHDGVYSVTRTGVNKYNPSQNYLTAVGSFTGSASYYGTYDQSGDVFNWSDTILGYNPAFLGGAWGTNITITPSSSFSDSQFSPTTEDAEFGFRLASIPEPSSVMLMLAGVFGMVWMRGKSFKL